ncbi:MAG: hypothetical protein KC442_21735 [Thermomicrobiales bacterium]|nr:hypothetical protein [Thermomicrobiales bacterium]MCA9880438.1 hypothetical protein [Thermomicrobiales bacterium]
MDAQGFERLSKQVAQAPNRRRMFGALGAGLGAAVLGRQMVDAESVEGELFGFCQVPGDTCRKKKDCCSHKCNDGVCGCLKRGKYAFTGLICCSGKRKKGKCK